MAGATQQKPKPMARLELAHTTLTWEIILAKGNEILYPPTAGDETYLRVKLTTWLAGYNYKYEYDFLIIKIRSRLGLEPRLRTASGMSSIPATLI